MVQSRALNFNFMLPSFTLPFYSSALLHPADKGYADAIIACGDAPTIVKLLCNRALCWIGKRAFEFALLDATAAIIVRPASAKSWYRRAQALHHLGKLQSAIKSCQQGSANLDPNDTAGKASFLQLAALIQRTLDDGENKRYSSSELDTSWTRMSQTQHCTGKR